MEESFRKQGKIMVYCGQGRGKTSAALGYGMLEAGSGKKVIVIQFLKQKMLEEMEFLKRLEPEIRLFRFSKSEKSFEELSEEQKAEEKANFINALNYSKKVLATGECDVLILDEVLGLIDEHVIQCGELVQVMDSREECDIVLTGRVLPEGMLDTVDEVYQIQTMKQG